jgi:hypothetical protein
MLFMWNTIEYNIASQKVAGSFPDEVIEFFSWPSSSSHACYGPRGRSAYDRNKYQESSWR